jgi:hypothetical protein
MQEDEIDIGLPEPMSGGHRFLGGIDQTEVHNVGAKSREAFRDVRYIALQPAFQSWKLRPIGIEPDPEEPDAQNVIEA